MFGFLSQRVYLQLFAAYALGIALMFRTPLPRELLLGWESLLIWSALLALLALAWIWRAQFAGRAALFALAVLIGALSVSLTLRGALDMPLRELAAGDSHLLRGRVASIPKYQRGHLRFMLDVEQVYDGRRYQPLHGRCFVFLRCDPGTPLYLTDRVRVFTALTEVEPPANRGQFNYRRYLLQRGTVLTAYLPTPRSLVRRDEHAPQPWAALSVARRSLLGAVTGGLPPHLGQLAASVIYGDKVVELPADLQDRWRRAGLTHIVVASGTQVSLLIGVLGLLLWRLGDGRTWRGRLLNLAQFSATLAAVLAYGAITGFETSIVRALVMGAVVLLGRLVSRQTDGMTALAQAGLIVLLANPLELLAAGFQLSFSATFGLIYGAGVLFPLTAQLSGWRNTLAQMFITTAGAQLFVSPALAWQFNQLSGWGLISNLLAIPLSFILLVAGALASFGLVYVPVLGALLKWFVWGLSWTLDLIARVFASLPGSNIAVPTPPWWWVVGCYLLILLAGEWLKTARAGQAVRPTRQAQSLTPRQLAALRFGIPMLALALCCGVGAWLIVPRPELVVLALPRGEGYLWRSATGRSVLLLRSASLGMNHNADTVASALRTRGINRLHGVVWLDKPPEEDLLVDWPAPVLQPGSELHQALDMRWLGEGRGVHGCRLGSGAGTVDVLWEPSRVPLGETSVQLAAVGARVWRELAHWQQQELAARGTVVVPQGGSDALARTPECELCVRGAVLAEYRPAGP